MVENLFVKDCLHQDVGSGGKGSMSYNQLKVKCVWISKTSNTFHTYLALRYDISLTNPYSHPSLLHAQVMH